MATVTLNQSSVEIVSIKDESGCDTLKIIEPTPPTILKIVAEGPIGPAGSTELDPTNYLIYYELAKG